ncbi:MAG: hypothetical protein ACYCQI_08495 [Gammaproteobacteria bacterium]
MTETRKSLGADFKKSCALEQQELLAALFSAFCGDPTVKIIANKEDPKKLKTEMFYRSVLSGYLRHPVWMVLTHLLPHFKSCLVFSKTNEPLEVNFIKDPAIPQVIGSQGKQSRDPMVCEITFTDLTSALQIFEKIINDKIQYQPEWFHSTYLADKENAKAILSFKRAMWRTRDSLKMAGDDVLGIIAGYLSHNGSALFANSIGALATLRSQSQKRDLDTQTKAALSTFFISEHEGQSLDISAAKALAENPNEEVTSLLAKMIT